MARALLDTDVLSEVIKNGDPNVAARAGEYLAAEGRFTVSVFSVMEIVYGFHWIGREDRIEQLRSLIADHEVLPFETATAATAGRIYADLERAGTPVGLADVMIAAVALHANLPLVTGNVGHFEAIMRAGHPLEIDNWLQPLVCPLSGQAPRLGETIAGRSRWPSGWWLRSGSRCCFAGRLALSGK